MDRTDTTFASSGVDCAAWLYQPGGTAVVPIVVMAHGFSGVRDQRLDAYAEQFARAGLAVLLFDYRFFGSSGGRPRQVIGIKAQLEDWRAAIGFARTLPGMDPSRVALFGSSFSGGHVVAIAAEDKAVAAVVAQCPFQDGLATLRALSGRASARVAWHALRDQGRALLGRTPHYIPAVAAPGELGLMTTPDSKPGFEAITSPGSTWQNSVAARVALHVGAYRPGRRAASLTCPALWCVSDDDALCPADVTERLASRAPHGEVKHYPCGHFDIYVSPFFEQAVHDQTEFLARHLVR